MSILRGPFEREQPNHTRAGEPYIPFKRERTSGRIATGSLACPTCDVPLTLGGPIAISGRMRCPFCRSIHPVRGFVALNTYDTSRNAVELRARLPRP